MIIFGVMFPANTLFVLLAVGFAVLAALVFWFKSRKRNKKMREIKSQWKHLLGLCKDPLNWPHVVVMADNLLAHALKTKKVRGKTTGEKLVKMQRIITDNDGIWQAHKFSRKLEKDPKTPVDKEQLKEMLTSFKQTLKDLGVL